jgi:hypothetical protein
MLGNTTRDMTRRIRIWQLTLCTAGVLITAGIIAWQAGPRPGTRHAVPANAVIVIAPYHYAGKWVFDDRAAGLVRMPIETGLPGVIDYLARDVPEATNGFRLLLSSQRFQGFQKRLTLLRGDMRGPCYGMEDPKMEVLLNPAVLERLAPAPPELFVRAEAKR